MKNNFRLLAVAFLAFTFAITSCNKKKEKEEEEQLQKEEQTLETENKEQSSDQSMVKNENDNGFDDANSAFSGTSLGKSANAVTICGATVDTTSIASKIIYLNYDGTTTCSGRKKTGQIKVQLIAGTTWRNAGSVIQLTYNNYKVTRVSDNKSITINGVQQVTKLSTIDWLVVYFGGSGSASYKTRSNNMSITFDDGTTRNWSAAHSSTYSVAAGVITATHSGDTTISGISQVSHWGTNRVGSSFTTAISTPIVSNSTCGFWKPVSGLVSHQVNGKTFTVTYGVDVSGNAVSNACAYGYKVNWTGVGGTAKQAIVSY